MLAIFSCIQASFYSQIKKRASLQIEEESEIKKKTQTNEKLTLHANVSLITMDSYADEDAY